MIIFSPSCAKVALSTITRLMMSIVNAFQTITRSASESALNCSDNWKVDQ